MRALTLSQPYASCIARGGKDIENRPLPVPSTIPIGSWIVLHAGARWWEQTTLESIRKFWPDCPSPDKLPYKQILGVWQLLGCETITSYQFRSIKSPWAFGPYCYQVGEVRLLQKPIDCKGMQGWWRVPVDIVERLQQELDIETRYGSSWTIRIE
jgi:hypothetical protein